MDETSPIGTENKKLASDEQTRAKIQESLDRLAKRREAGEIDPEDYNLDELFYDQGAGTPLDRRSVGKMAVVITQAQLEQLGGLTMVRGDGKVIIFEPEVTGYGPNDPLVIFPEDLGDLSAQN